MGGSLPRPQKCICCEFNPNVQVITREGTLLFTTTQQYIQIGKSPHIYLLQQAGLSSAKARPARTSYRTLLNEIYFTTYFFMRETEELANGTRIIPSLVTPPIPINSNALSYGDLFRVSFNIKPLQYLSPMSKSEHGHILFDAEESPSKSCRHVHKLTLRGQPTGRQQTGSPINRDKHLSW